MLLVGRPGHFIQMWHIVITEHRLYAKGRRIDAASRCFDDQSSASAYEKLIVDSETKFCDKTVNIL